MSNNLFGNLTTVVNFISLAVFPYVSVYGVTQDQLTALLSLIIGVLFAYVNAKYPNTFKFLGNAPVSSEAQTEEDIIESNDYEVGDQDGC